MSISIDKKHGLHNITLFILTMLLATSFIAYNNTGLSSLSVIAVTACLLGIYLINNGGLIELKITKFHVIVLLFAIFCLCSAMWAIGNAKDSIEASFTIVEILICMSVVFFNYQKQSDIGMLLKAVMWSGFVIVVYSVAFYGVGRFMSMLRMSSRIGNTYANANAIGMWMSITITICVYYILYEGWKWGYLLFALPVVLLAMSQSRTAIIELVCGLLLVTVFKFSDRKNVLKGLFRIITALAVVILILYGLSKIELFSAVKGRMEGLINTLFGNAKIDRSTRLRTKYIEAGFRAFLENPIFGIGIGNTGEITEMVDGTHSYLHNNFVEMLASGGIVGFCLYYAIYFYSVTTLIKLIRNKVKYSEICLILLIMVLISEWGTVTYYSKEIYLLFTVCALHIFINRSQLNAFKTIGEKK